VSNLEVMTAVEKALNWAFDLDYHLEILMAPLMASWMVAVKVLLTVWMMVQS
jgi:hypothetical protein